MVITRKVEFSASHVYEPAAFRRGKSAAFRHGGEPHGHGQLRGEVSGKRPDPVTGMVLISRS
jgi:hypothetical protein